MRVYIMRVCGVYNVLRVYIMRVCGVYNVLRVCVCVCVRVVRCCALCAICLPVYAKRKILSSTHPLFA